MVGCYTPEFSAFYLFQVVPYYCSYSLHCYLCAARRESKSSLVSGKPSTLWTSTNHLTHQVGPLRASEDTATIQNRPGLQCINMCRRQCWYHLLPTHLASCYNVISLRQLVKRQWPQGLLYSSIRHTNGMDISNILHNNRVFMNRNAGISYLKTSDYILLMASRWLSIHV